MFGVTPTRVKADGEPPLPSIERAERLCQAFEYHLMMFPTPQITFEHAILLLKELARGIELRVATCSVCYSLIVVDALTPRDDVTCSSRSCLQNDCRRG
jgi:ATP adenylyltransferase/5',5'''-P-1,P-4-tetraphosphate phosphorylase II